MNRGLAKYPLGGKKRVYTPHCLAMHSVGTSMKPNGHQDECQCISKYYKVIMYYAQPVGGHYVNVCHIIK